MANTFYGYWTCDYCGEENRGDMQKCRACGKNRGKDVKFYMTPKKSNEGREYVENYSGDGPDWLCGYCDSLNPASQTVCRNCGHPREEADKDYYQLHAEREEVHQEDEFTDAPTPEPAPAAPMPTRTRHAPRWPLLLLVVALVAVMVYTLMPRERTLTVVGKDWARTVTVEEYRTVQEEDWSVPQGGRQTGAYRAIHHYQQVLDHYETVTRSRQVASGGHNEVVGYRDNGNGTFTEVTQYVTDYTTEYYDVQEPVYRNDPVYATKYRYDIERWVFDHEEETRGTTDEPYFATPELTDRQRTNGTGERYTITGSYEARKGDVRTDTYPLTYEQWAPLQVGQSLHVKIHSGGQLELLD